MIDKVLDQVSSNLSITIKTVLGKVSIDLIGENGIIYRVSSVVVSELPWEDDCIGGNLKQIIKGVITDFIVISAEEEIRLVGSELEREVVTVVCVLVHEVRDAGLLKGSEQVD